MSTLPGGAAQGAIGPALDGVATKYDVPQLRQLVADSKVYFPGTIMPSYYKPAGAAEPSVLTAGDVEDLVAYLKTLK